eukprot:13764155-Ditylum_brightwellii.AAC.1
MATLHKDTPPHDALRHIINTQTPATTIVTTTTNTPKPLANTKDKQAKSPLSPINITTREGTPPPAILPLSPPKISQPATQNNIALPAFQVMMCNAAAPRALFDTLSDSPVWVEVTNNKKKMNTQVKSEPESTAIAMDAIWAIATYNNKPKQIYNHFKPSIDQVRLILEKTLEKHCPCLKVEEIVHIMDGLEFYKW